MGVEVRVVEVEGRDSICVFADTTTEGMDGSCEWDEFELVMLWTSEASLALAASPSLSEGFCFSFPLAELALPLGVLLPIALFFTFPNRPPPDVAPLNFQRTSNSPLTRGTLLS